MAKKPAKTFLSSQRDILNFKPNIHFVEPEQVEDSKLPTPPESATLDSIKLDTEKLIEDYKNIETEASNLLDEIGNKASTVTIKLDPNQDSHILDALQRHFNDPNKTEITYDDYVTCLQEINEAGAEKATTVNTDDVIAASTDQYRDVFGSLGIQSGLARPELAPHAKMVDPIDMGKFKAEQLLKLIEMLTPGINDLIIKKVKELVF